MPLDINDHVDEAESDEEGDDIFPSEMWNNDPSEEIKNIDALIAKEMSSLTMQDRENVYYDLHGVSSVVEESPELLQNSLHEIEQILMDLAPSWNAYQLALNMNRVYVQNPDFLLRFLRADKFNTQLAALRFVNFWERKLELFGSAHLVTEITQSILDPETLQVMGKGYVQRLPQRDRAGRSVSVNLGQTSEFSVLAKLRMTFYFGMFASEDVETQRRGVVSISYMLDKPFDMLNNFQHAKEWNKGSAKLLQSLPLRFEAFHACTNTLPWRIVMGIFQMCVAPSVRVRTRIHHGTREECLLNLQTFGIVVEDFPVDKEGKMSKQRYLRYVEKRKKFEDMVESAAASGKSIDLSTRVTSPRRHDVLLGRGRMSYLFSGNVLLRTMVAERADKYDKSSIWEKGNMNAEIVELIQEKNGRFLMEDEAGWEVVSDVVARKKVAHAFRTLRKLMVVPKSEGTKSNDEEGGERSKRSRPDY